MNSRATTPDRAMHTYTLSILGTEHRGIWERERMIETKVLTTYQPPEKWSLNDPDAWRYLKAGFVGTPEDRRNVAARMPHKVKTEDQHLPFTQTYLIFTTDKGSVYRIAMDHHNPERDDYPQRIEPPPGEISFPECKAGMDGRSWMKGAVLTFPDGTREYVTFSETHPPPLDPVEVISLEVEDLIFSECDHPRYEGLTAPTMREFYTGYVINRRTLKAIAKNAGCSVRTVKNRKEHLQQDLFIFHKIRTPLQLFQKNPELREARDKHARNRLKR